MKTNLVAMIVGLAVAIVVAGSVLLPVVIDSEQSLYVTHTYTSQNYAGKMDKFTTTDSHILSWEDSKLTIDDVETELMDITRSGLIFLTEKIALYQLADKIYFGSSGSQTDITSSSISMVVSAGEITYSVGGGDAVQITYTTGYILNPNGQYVTSSTSSEGVVLYFKDNSQISGYRVDGVMRVYLDGVSYSDGTQTQTPYTVVSTDVEDSDGNVKQLNGVKYTSSKPLTVYIVPLSVSYETTDYADIIQLLQVIPVLVIIGIVIAAVSIIAFRRA